jgi:hypothetical protein
MAVHMRLFISYAELSSLSSHGLNVIPMNGSTAGIDRLEMRFQEDQRRIEYVQP